jgi:hypothetical protein
MLTLSTPTMDRQQQEVPQTPEETAWRTKAQILALMHMGFTYSEAAHMSIADYRRYMAIERAWSIPPDRRVFTKMATAEDDGLIA